MSKIRFEVNDPEKMSSSELEKAVKEASEALDALRILLRYKKIAEHELKQPK